ncbi:MAG: hypothetical protein ACRCX6_08065, partial [Plesiomonas shigelloides]
SQVLLRKEGGGRVAAHEIMLGTPAIRNLIREDKIHQIYSILQTSSRQGMQTLEQALNVLTSQGVVSYEEAQRKMNSLMDGGIQNGNTASGTGAGAMGYGFAG